MSTITESQLSDFLKRVKILEGGPSPYLKRERKNRSGVPMVVPFGDENIRWVGRTMTHNMFAHGSYSSVQAMFGISPYRIVLYAGMALSRELCRSYWFDVDFEGLLWRRGMTGKTYRGLTMLAPVEKRAMNGRVKEIKISAELLPAAGKAKSAYQHSLGSLEGASASGKWTSKESDSVWSAVSAAFQSRRRVPVSSLMILSDRTRDAVDHIPAQGQPHEHVAPVPLAAAPNPVPASVAAAAPAAPPSPVAQASSDPSLCPTCGTPKRANATFCAGCGGPIAAAEPPPTVVESQDTPADSAEPDEVSAGEIADEGPAQVAPATCGACGQAVEKNWVACPFCGEGLSPSCGNCGRQLKAGWVACPACGTRLAD